MDFFPAFLNLRDRRVLVVGGGDIALRKIRLLCSAGAIVDIIAERASDAVTSFAEEHGHQIQTRRFRADDVAGHWLVVSATGDAEVERQVFAAATAAGIFCNGVDDIANCSYITPAIVDRSPIVIAISSGGAAPVLARKLRSQIELMIPVGLSRLADLAARWRSRVTNKLTDLLSRRRFWEALFDGPIVDHAVAGNEALAEQQLLRLLENTASQQPGQAWLVGAGPGDPQLLTVRAVQILQMADVILHDRLVSPEVLAMARRDADLISVGKAPGCSMNSQEAINARLVELVRSGKRVCRLKGGDPFIFGRGGEEMLALADAGFACEVVPGVTAAAGCAASAGIPLTHRGLSQSVAFVTAHGQDSIDNLDWAALARDRQTLAFYMAVSRFSDLMNRLIDNGRTADTPIAIIENGTTPAQRVIRGTLGQLTMLSAAHKVAAPAMLIVGEVAAIAADPVSTSSQAVENCATPESINNQKRVTQ